MRLRESGFQNQKTIVIVHKEGHEDWDRMERMKRWAKQYKIIILILDENDTTEELVHAVKNLCNEQLDIVYIFHDESALGSKLKGYLKYRKMVVEDRGCVPGGMVEKVLCG